MALLIRTLTRTLLPPWTTHHTRTAQNARLRVCWSLKPVEMPPRRSVASSSKKRERDQSDASDTDDIPTKSATKHKAAAPESDNSGSESSMTEKKAKTSQSSKPRKKAKTSPSVSTERASIGQPTNKVLPVHIEFPPKIADTVRLVTWNICGLAASSKKVHGLSRDVCGWTHSLTP